jgi:serine/threonine protein kinase
VFRAYHPEQDRLVAVKLFRLDLPPERVHQLVADLEHLVAADLSHPGIAAPIGAGLVDVSAYLAQDFVAAESLDVVVRAGGSLPLADVARIAAQLGGALDFAAARDVLHGALHPRDILLSDDDVWMTGLGITRALEHLGVPTPVRRPYSAPERAVGGPWDRRADLFSLAALIFELLYGRRVSGAGDRAVAALPTLPGTDRAGLKRVFARALSADPGGRFESGLAFADALGSALSEMLPAVEPPAAAPVVPTGGAAVSLSEDFRLTSGDLDGLPDEPLLPLSAPDFDTAEIFEHVQVPEGDLEDAPVLPEPSADDLDLHTGTTLLEEMPPSATVSSPVAPEAPMPFSAIALESTRSAVWPLVLALVVGIAIGFGIAMGFVGRDQARSVAAVPLPMPSQAPEPPAAPTVITEEPVIPVTGASRPPAGRGTGASAATPSAPAPSTPAARAAAPTPAAPRPPAVVTGRIQVRTTPSGADVSLDGRNAGTTPLTLRDVARGTHTVRVTRDGYVAAERRVVVSATRQSPSVTIALARVRAAERPAGRPSAPATPARSAAASAPQSGSLTVDSRPTGANVFVDGKLVGTTPLVVEKIDVGEHPIHMELAGYRRWAAAVKIVAGERARIAASLEQ